MIFDDRKIAELVAIQKNCGYWELQNKFYFSKVECFRYASLVKDYNIKYHFFDSAYRNLNWSIEPRESLEELYKNRAQQLRDKYDYLILSFSGGSDSSNILHSFIDNNIKLDEVYCEYPISPLEKTKHKFNYDKNDALQITLEWYTAAKPAIERLSQTNPEIKITVDDVSQDAVLLVDNCDVHKWFRGGSSVNPNTMKYYKLYEIARDREKYGRVGCITGLDKPRIAYSPKTKTFFSTYSDFNNIFSEFPDEAFSGYQARLEYFYYAYDFPQLNQKQCFELKKSLLQLLETESTDGFFYKSLLQFINPNGIHVYDVHHDFFKKVLYTKWNTNVWQAKKHSNFFYPSVSQWFYDKEITSDKTRDFYDKQILELISGVDNNLLQYENGKPHSFKTFITDPINF